jgi:hypothetical protein
MAIYRPLPSSMPWPSISKAKQRDRAQAAIKAVAGRLTIKRDVRCACGHHAIMALPAGRPAQLKYPRCKAIINVAADTAVTVATSGSILLCLFVAKRFI